MLRSLRMLGRNWRLTTAAIFSLSVAMALVIVSLGISNTSLLVAPGGVSAAGLAEIYLRTPQAALDHISYPDYEFYRAHNGVFTDVAAVAESISVVRVISSADGSGKAGREVAVSSNPVSGNYFSVLGIRPYMGRFFSNHDEPSKAPVAVMTYSAWRRLGADPKIVGTTLGSYAIVGVAPKQFTGSLFGLNGDLVTLLAADNTPAARRNRGLVLLARLRPRVSRKQAQADLSLLSAELAQSYPDSDKDCRAILTRATMLPPDAIPATELAVTILLILVLLVLLIASANVANLLLALATGRTQEATIKLALGCPRQRLVREFLRESVILCAASGGLGYLVAKAAIARYGTFTVDVPMLGAYSIGLKLHLGLTVAIATAALMLLTILATGLPAALHVSRPNLSQVLSGEAVPGGRRKAARGSALVIAQISICTLVLVGMGLCQRSLHNLRSVGFGFSARNLLGAELYAGDLGLAPTQGRELYARVQQEVRRLPGVQSVALASDLPLIGDTSEKPVRIPGAEKPVSVMSATVDPNYFTTLGIPLLEGRVFRPTDAAHGPYAVVINRKLARTMWPGEQAIGQELLVGNPPRTANVIGVVADGKYGGLDEAPQPLFYDSTAQHYRPGMIVIARTAGDPRLWVRPLAKAVEAGGFPPMLRPMTFSDVENLALLSQRLVAASVGGLSALGLLLAIVGLFGAVSYSVSERRKEFGIRLALGGSRWQLLRMILAQTLKIAGSGVALGVVLGVAATALLRSQFYRIASVEWSVLVPVAAAMLAISLIVAWLSARRWLKVDPMIALRHV